MKDLFSESKKRIDEFAVAAAVDHQHSLRRYLRRRLKRGADLDDLAQEVYVRLLRMKDEAQVSRIREPIAYVYRVASRVISDWNKSVEDFVEYGIDFDSMNLHRQDLLQKSQSDPEESLANQQCLERIFGQLPPIQGAVLLLLERDGLSHENIATNLKISVGMVHYHLTRARSKVRMWATDE